MVNVRDSFSGKNVLVTGATGFIGKILIEKMLRSLPDVGDIYLLIRVKKDQQPSDRFRKEILSSKVFDTLRNIAGTEEEFERRFASKLVPVPGDVSQDNLGMSKEVWATLTANVNRILHCAATVNFQEPLIEAVNKNTLGTMRMLQLAKDCVHFDCFCHVSTAYVLSNDLKNKDQAERLVPLPQDPEKLLETILKMEAKERISKTPAFLGNYPNTYTYTKNLAEQLLKRRRGTIPIAIFRPTIVGATLTEPVPGWLDTINAAAAIYFTVGMGLMKVAVGKPMNVGDQIPADMVVNAILADAAAVAGKNQLMVFHMGTSARNPMEWRFVRDMILPYWKTRPPHRLRRTVDFNFIRYQAMFDLVYFLKYTVPIGLYSSYANALGTPQQKKKAETMKVLSGRLRKLSSTLSYFISNEWHFDITNQEKVMATMSPEEKVMFNIDVNTIDWEMYMKYFCYGIVTYVLKEEGHTPPDKDRNVKLNMERRMLADVSFAYYTNPGVSSKQHCSAEEMKSLVMYSPSVQAAIRASAESQGVPVASVESQAMDILNTMAGELNIPIMRAESWAFRKFYRNLYQGVIVDEVGLRKVKAAAAKAPLILIPTHRSYIDFLIVTFVFFIYSVPLPHIAAGDDFLNMAVVNWLLRNSGAFFMRRSFAKDKLYRVIFAEYLLRVLHHGDAFEFFIEGTRSRTGKNVMPKMGVLSILMDGITSESLPDANVVPISIGYEKMVEENSHTKELLGEQKQKPTTTAMIKAFVTRLLNLNFGRINVQFAEPIPLKDWVAQHTSLERQTRQMTQLSAAGSQPIPVYDPVSNPLDKKHMVNKFAFKLLSEMNDNMVCMCPALVSSLILAHRHGVTLERLVARFSWLREAIVARGGRIDPVRGTDEELVKRALGLLRTLVSHKRGVIEPRVKNGNFSSFVLLGVYRNQIIHIFSTEATIACAIASFGLRLANQEGIVYEALLERFHFLAKLLTVEFTQNFTEYEREKMFEIAIGFMVNQEKMLGWSKDGTKIVLLDNSDPSPSKRAFSYMCSLVAPFVDSYWLSCLALYSLKPVGVISETVFMQRMQWLAEKMYLEGAISHYECISKDALRNSLTVYESWGVLTCEGEGTQRTIRLADAYAKGDGLQDLIKKVGLFRKTPIISSSEPEVLVRAMIADDSPTSTLRTPLISAL